MEAAMSGHFKARGRVLLAGKVIFNFGQSTISCMVRRITEDGATIEVESGLGVPDTFELLVASEGLVQFCKLVWRSEKQIGVSFGRPVASDPSSLEESSKQGSGEHALRAHTLALRAALDHSPLGIVLLDRHLNARFINRLSANLGPSRRQGRPASLICCIDVSRARHWCL
jgi:hypothetical protein